MKKTLVLASLLAAFGAASAQTSVTVGGTTSFGYQRDAKASSLAETDFSLTFKGSEKLASGLTAAFSVELDNSSASFRQLNTGTTTLTDSNGDTTTVQADRQGVRRKNTSLSLSGDFGTVTLANTRGSEAGAMALVAPTNLNADFYSSGVINRPNIDLLGYSTNVGPLSVGVSYTEGGTGEGMGANTANDTSMGSRTSALSLGYASGALALKAAFKKSTGSSTAVAGGLFKHNGSNFELGATLDLGAAKLGLGYDSKPTTGTNDNAALLFGVSVPMGASSFGVNYGKRDAASMYEVGFQHNLSARTNVNASVGKYGAAVKVNQYRLSLNHAF